MTERECPVDLSSVFAAMARGEAKPFTKADYECYAGVEGEDAYTLEMDGCVVVLDLGPTCNFQVIWQDPDGPDMACWMFEAGGFAEWQQIV